MPRLREVPRSETDSPVVNAMYDLVFGKDVDPLVDGGGTATGSEGNWWTVHALSPDVMEHAVDGFVLYRSPERKLDPVIRELAMTRAGWARGSRFVYSQHAKALRGLGVEEEKIAGVAAWPVCPAYSPFERAVLAYADAIVHDGGRVADEVFDLLRAELGDEALLELTYLTAMYDMHATVARALKLETDDRPEPVAELASPEDFDAERYVQVGATEDAKAQFEALK
jgi:alkylhydroperoxidase family enzyme